MVLYNEVPSRLRDAVAYGDECLRGQQEYLNEISHLTHRKVLTAFREAKVSAYHLQGSTGYGLGDSGKKSLDEVVARIMGTEAALLRHQMVSGTHAIAAALYGLLRPGDHFLSVSGLPYDTLLPVIGVAGGDGKGSLRDWGVAFDYVSLDEDSNISFERVREKVTPKTKVFILQRSRGYADRKSLAIAKIKAFIQEAKREYPDILIFVDNCYGELVEGREPGDAGADLLAGSLIKNLGGFIAPAGGYIAGKASYVELAAGRFAAPGIGLEVGASLDVLRLLYQGVFISPLTVSEAVRSAVFSAAFWAHLGFEVDPGPQERRTDIIQTVKLGSSERLTAFCQGLQKGSPIDAHVMPIPAPMPGYQDEVIMAGGTFIQGATSEFSVDAPLRPPYTAYMQGGVSHNYVKEANVLAAGQLAKQGLLP